MVGPYLLPEFKIIVDDSLGFTVKVFGLYLTDHSIYKKYRRSVQKALIKNLGDYILCCGASTAEFSSKLVMSFLLITTGCRSIMTIRNSFQTSNSGDLETAYFYLFVNKMTLPAMFALHVQST